MRDAAIIARWVCSAAPLSAAALDTAARAPGGDEPRDQGSVRSGPLISGYGPHAGGPAARVHCDARTCESVIPSSQTTNSKYGLIVLGSPQQEVPCFSEAE